MMEQGMFATAGVLATTRYAAAAIMTVAARKLVIVGIVFQGKSSLFFGIKSSRENYFREIPAIQGTTFKVAQ